MKNLPMFGSDQRIGQLVDGPRWMDVIVVLFFSWQYHRQSCHKSASDCAFPSLVGFFVEGATQPRQRRDASGAGPSW